MSNGSRAFPIDKFFVGDDLYRVMSDGSVEKFDPQGNAFAYVWKQAYKRTLELLYGSTSIQL